MTIRSPFRANYGSGQTIAVAASASVSIRAEDKSVRVVNYGAAIGYFRTGTGTVTATAADVAVPAGGSIIIEKPMTHDKIATFSGGTDFHVMTGEGGV